jgi:hypothetical protein
VPLFPVSCCAGRRCSLLGVLNAVPSPDMIVMDFQCVCGDLSHTSVLCNITWLIKIRPRTWAKHVARGLLTVRYVNGGGPIEE